MKEALSVKELAEGYGTMVLLTALIMRQQSCSEEAAEEICWRIHEEVDCLIEFTVDNEE